MKRSPSFPNRRSYGEFKLNSQRKYNQITKQPSKINTVFLEDHYGIVKEVSK